MHRRICQIANGGRRRANVGRGEARRLGAGARHGITFEPEAEAIALFKEFEGEICSTALLSPEGEERCYYSSHKVRPLSEAHERFSHDAEVVPSSCC